MRAEEFVHPTSDEQDRALIEAHHGTWKELATEGQTSQSVKLLTCPLFDKTLAEKSNIPGVAEKFNSFVEQKTANPAAPFGSKDSPFMNAGPLSMAVPKLRHAHLTRDLSVFYTIGGKDPTVIRLYGIFSHKDSGTGTPGSTAKQKSLGQRMKYSEFDQEFGN
jgi:hypothetical protein